MRLPSGKKKSTNKTFFFRVDTNGTHGEKGQEDKYWGGRWIENATKADQGNQGLGPCAVVAGVVVVVVGTPESANGCRMRGLGLGTASAYQES